MTLLVALGIPAFVAVPFLAGFPRTQETRPGKDEVARQRAENERFYLLDYLERREWLFARSAGKWIAIVGGESTSTCETLADCIRAADAKDPKALHRFVFRIGEDGPVSYRLGAAQSSNQIGLGWFMTFDIRPMTFDVVDGELTCRRGEKSKVFPMQGCEISLSLGEPGGDWVRPIRVCASTGFTGIALFDGAVAKELGLARFEIPGEVSMEDTFGGRGVFRRARVRVQVPELEIDETLPVAVRKE